MGNGTAAFGSHSTVSDVCSAKGLFAYGLKLSSATLEIRANVCIVDGVKLAPFGREVGTGILGYEPATEHKFTLYANGLITPGKIEVGMIRKAQTLGEADERFRDAKFVVKNAQTEYERVVERPERARENLEDVIAHRDDLVD